MSSIVPANFDDDAFPNDGCDAEVYIYDLQEHPGGVSRHTMVEKGNRCLASLKRLAEYIENSSKGLRKEKTVPASRLLLHRDCQYFPAAGGRGRPEAKIERMQKQTEE